MPEPRSKTKRQKPFGEKNLESSGQIIGSNPRRIKAASGKQPGAWRERPTIDGRGGNLRSHSIDGRQLPNAYTAESVNADKLGKFAASVDAGCDSGQSLRFS